MTTGQAMRDAALTMDGVTGGDVAWVTSFEMNGAREACVGVLWARTGRAALYTMASWASRFNLIPLERPELSDQISLRDVSAPANMLPQPRNINDIILKC